MYEIVVRPESHEFVAICPQIPGLTGKGATPGQALDAALSALRTWFAARGTPPPEPVVIRATLNAPARV